MSSGTQSIIISCQRSDECLHLRFSLFADVVRHTNAHINGDIQSDIQSVDDTVTLML